jgi:hypothetical protein
MLYYHYLIIIRCFSGAILCVSGELVLKIPRKLQMRCFNVFLLSLATQMPPKLIYKDNDTSRKEYNINRTCIYNGCRKNVRKQDWKTPKEEWNFLRKKPTRDNSEGKVCCRCYSKLFRVSFILLIRSSSKINDMFQEHRKQLRDSSIAEEILNCEPMELVVAEANLITSPTSVAANPSQGPGRKPKFPPMIRNCIGKLQIIGISARRVPDVLEATKEMHQKATNSKAKKMDLTCCVETAEVCLIELALNLLTIRSRRLAASNDLFIMVDGSGTTKLQRSLFAVHFGGFLNNEKWSSLFGLYEFVAKGAEVDVKAIIATLEHVRELQKDNHWTQTRLYNFKTITFDNCSENTGRSNGVGVLLQRFHRDDFTVEDPYIQSRIQYSELVAKGCSDHITNLVSSDIEKTIVAVLKERKQTRLLSGSKTQSVATTVLLNLYSKSDIIII